MEENRFSTFIRELRMEKGLSQEELAKALYVHRTTVNKWEKENVIPLNDKLLTIADFFNVSVDELLNGKRNEIGEDSSDRNNTIIELIKSKKKSQKCFIYCSIICLFLVVGFLAYYFISNYNSVKVYRVFGENDNIKTRDGVLFFSKDKVYYKPGYFYDSKDSIINVEFIRLYYFDKDNNDAVLLTGSSKELYIELNKSQEAFVDILSKKRDLFLDACYNNMCYKISLNYFNDFKNDDLVGNDLSSDSVSSLTNKPSDEKTLLKNLLDNGFVYDEEEKCYIKSDNEVDYKYVKNSNMILANFKNEEEFDIVKIMLNVHKVLMINDNNSDKNIYIPDYKNTSDKNYQVFKKYFDKYFSAYFGDFLGV